MKRLVFLLALILGANVWSQNSEKEIDTVIVTSNQKTIKYTDGSQHVEIIKQTSHQISPTKRRFKSKQDEMAYLKKYISQLETKMDHVKKDPEQHKQAQEKGWYAEMNSYIQQSKARLQEITDLLDSKEK